MTKPITPEMMAAGGKESSHQKAVFLWAALNLKQYPELKFMYHIPNGGYRNSAEAANLKAAGVKSGVPDIHLPVPRGNYHGLYVELKVLKGKASLQQNEWIDFLKSQGYGACVCYGWQEVVKVIQEYLEWK